MALGNLIRLWTAARGSEIVIPDFWALDLYGELTGFDRDVPGTDLGVNVLEMLTSWRDDGVTLPNREPDRLIGFQRVPMAALHNALWQCGALLAVVALPLDAQRQDHFHLTQGAGSVPGGWGHHCVAVVGSEPMCSHVVTWGKRILATRDWMERYTVELYAAESALWNTGPELAAEIDALNGMRAFSSPTAS